MPKNRDSTGLFRTPPSMARLIGHRAEQLDMAETALEEPLERIRRLREEIKIDAVIPHHRLKIDPTIIQGKRVYAPRILGSGQMTRESLRAAREAAPWSLFTSEIASRIARIADVEVAKLGEAELMDRVGRRSRRRAQPYA